MRTFLLLALATSTLALSGCATPPHAERWEYKTVILKNNSQADTLPNPSDGWVDSDDLINEMAKDGWIVAGYTLDTTTSQWFLLKRQLR